MDFLIKDIRSNNRSDVSPFQKDVVDEEADCVVILAGINDLAENNGLFL